MLLSFCWNEGGRRVHKAVMSGDVMQRLVPLSSLLDFLSLYFLKGIPLFLEREKRDEMTWNFHKRTFLNEYIITPFFTTQRDALHCFSHMNCHCQNWSQMLWFYNPIYFIKTKGCDFWWWCMVVGDSILRMATIHWWQFVISRGWWWWWWR